MSSPLSPTQRTLVLDAAYDALASALPGCFSENEWHRAGGVAEVEKHLDPLIDIVRRTSAKRIEPFQVQILEDICDKCPQQEASGYCSLRKIHKCALYECANPLIEAIAAALIEVQDPEYLEHHPHVLT